MRVCHSATCPTCRIDSVAARLTSSIPTLAIMFRAIERRLEKLVEGGFNKALKSGLQPVELGRRLVKIMDASRTVGVRGALLVPNDFVISLSSDDLERLAAILPSLRRDLVLTAKDHAAAEGYKFAGPVVFTFAADAKLRTGMFSIDGIANAQAVGDGPPALLTLDDGSTRPIELHTPFVIGRNSDCSLPITDPNVSRVHAQIISTDDGFVITDNDSTNGTFVNDVAVTSTLLRNGDMIRIGPVQARFSAE